MTPHAPGKLRADHGAALVHLDGVLAAAEGVLDYALHLEKVTLTHVSCRTSKALGKTTARTLS
jgi:hypothetical protein